MIARVIARVTVRDASLVLALVAYAACNREQARAPADSVRAARATTAPADSAQARIVAQPLPHSTADTAAPVRGDTNAWRVTARGVGGVTFGMSIDQAARIAGGTIAHPPGGSCGFTSLRDVPHGARFMVSYDTVVRADVGTAAVATDAGARVGMSEDSVEHLYANKLRVMPHKYVRGGHYLILVPGAPADTMHQLIFETDGDRVTRYRAGLVPYVGYVEGCG